MHHALEIEEILLNIFGHCQRPIDLIHSLSQWGPRRIELVSLARTCRVFKEPALNLLWDELLCLSILARCLPDASQQCADNCYSFHRSLTQIEWGTLRSYTSRIRSMRLENINGLDQKSLDDIFNPPAGTESLFPNVRHLDTSYANETTPIFTLPLPSLISFRVRVSDSRFLGNHLESLGKTSPSLSRLSIHSDIQAVVDMSGIDSDLICQWKNLRDVSCPGVRMGATPLVHLSRMTALTRLSFTLPSSIPDQISPSDTPLFFHNLHDLTLCLDFLSPVSRFLCRSRLSAITTFAVFIEHCPSRLDLSAFLISVQTSGIGQTIMDFTLEQQPVPNRMYASPGHMPVFSLEDLKSFMAFIHLRQVNLDLLCPLNLGDNDLFALTSSWPHLEHLSINKSWGWNTQGGISPRGLLQLLQTKPLLTRFSLVIDTRGYTNNVLPSLEHPGLTISQPKFTIDVVDSCIEVESIPAIAALFAHILARGDCALIAWAHPGKALNPNQPVYGARWREVCRLTGAIVSSRHDGRVVYPCQPWLVGGPMLHIRDPFPREVHASGSRPTIVSSN